MARVCKSLIPEQGYPHRDHRSKKARMNWKPRIHLKKRRLYKEKIKARRDAELAKEEEIILTKYK